MKVKRTTAIAVMMAAISVGTALADNNPPATPPDNSPTLTQPTVTSDPADAPIQTMVPLPAAPSSSRLPVAGQTVQTLLLKQLRSQIVLYRQSTWRWQRLMGMKVSPGGNLWNLGGVTSGNRLLQTWKSRSLHLHAAARRWMRNNINANLQAVEHMRLVMGLKPIGRTLASSASTEERFTQVSRLKAETYKQYIHPPHEPQFMCIHSHEGSWTDPGAPFWGGLQMNWSFMATYGPWLLRHKGTADHWTPLEQMWVAARAVDSGRGFYPWPNTARMCGLI